MMFFLLLPCAFCRRRMVGEQKMRHGINYGNMLITFINEMDKMIVSKTTHTLHLMYIMDCPLNLQLENVWHEENVYVVVSVTDTGIVKITTTRRLCWMWSFPPFSVINSYNNGTSIESCCDQLLFHHWYFLTLCTHYIIIARRKLRANCLWLSKRQQTQCHSPSIVLADNCGTQTHTALLWHTQRFLLCIDNVRTHVVRRRHACSRVATNFKEHSSRCSKTICQASIHVRTTTSH